MYAPKTDFKKEPFRTRRMYWLTTIVLRREVAILQALRTFRFTTHCRLDCLSAIQAPLSFINDGIADARG
jgi:hypothetical protein